MKIKEILIKYVGIGLLLTLTFIIVLFVISLIFNFEDTGASPTLLPTIVFSVFMGLIVRQTLKSVTKAKNHKQVWKYALVWTGVVFISILLVTIPNSTTKIFFGRWFSLLPFITMAIMPLTRV